VDLELDDGLGGKGTSRGETDRATAADAAEATTATEEDTGDGVFLAAEGALAVAAAAVAVADFGETSGGVRLGVVTEAGRGGGGVRAFGELFSRFSRSSKERMPAAAAIPPSVCLAAAAAAAAAAVPAGWRRGITRPLALALAADRARGEDIIGEPMAAGVDGALLESGHNQNFFRISQLPCLSPLLLQMPGGPSSPKCRSRRWGKSAQRRRHQGSALASRNESARMKHHRAHGMLIRAYLVA
jgi:hypothetical protein